MQLSITALLGLLLATADASRCKNRPGHGHHHSGRPGYHSSRPAPSIAAPAASSAGIATSYAAAPPETATSSVEATQQVSTTTVEVSSTAPAISTVVTTESQAPVSSYSVQPTIVDTPVESASTSTEAPVVSPPTVPTTTSAEIVSTEVATSVSSAVSSAVASVVPSAVAIANAPAQVEMCADDQNQLLTEWGLIVSNFRVQESSVEGTVCTTYNGMVTLPNGQAAAKFTADANLVYDETTINDNKYYSNVGLGANIPSQLSSISSIPASYSWSRTNTTAFRGNVVFDLVLAPTSEDRTSSATEEVMMWLHWQGDQLPLAWNNGTKATFDLYGTTWDMYQGINYNLANGEGVQVTTILPSQDLGATGSWSGDIMDWMNALVAQGVFSADYYVTNANAGTEQYWGDSVLESTVAMEINLNA